MRNWGEWLKQTAGKEKEAANSTNERRSRIVTTVDCTPSRRRSPAPPSS